MGGDKWNKSSSLKYNTDGFLMENRSPLKSPPAHLVGSGRAGILCVCQSSPTLSMETEKCLITHVSTAYSMLLKIAWPLYNIRVLNMHHVEKSPYDIKHIRRLISLFGGRRRFACDSLKKITGSDPPHTLSFLLPLPSHPSFFTTTSPSQ